MPNITVFGASKPAPGEPLYEEALLLGRLIGAAGWAVLTGGYIGTMEAVSRGASEAGGHVIGVTCDEIESWRDVGPNPWVREERRFPTNNQRLLALIDGCEAAVALPGGIGTLAEVAVMWSQLQIGAITPRPLLIVGPAWRATLETFITRQGDLIPERDHAWVIPVEDAQTAFRRLQDHFSG
ncbi:MAG: LOG family protein [Anaerolineales bacterium]|nr:LOG family protein [Anaerolineales bacterium]